MCKRLAYIFKRTQKRMQQVLFICFIEHFQQKTGPSIITSKRVATANSVARDIKRIDANRCNVTDADEALALESGLSANCTTV